RRWLYRREAPIGRHHRIDRRQAARHWADRPDAPPRPGARMTATFSSVHDPAHRPLKVAALGGGHGLAASLRALRHITTDITAIVTVADDGGSSGRLRQELDVLPPGDLRMALAALCAQSDWG